MRLDMPTPAYIVEPTAIIGEQSTDGMFDDVHHDIACSLHSVRRADGVDARSVAFGHCKRLLYLHDLAEPLSVPTATIVAATALVAVHRRGERSRFLAKAIVRELEGWPQADAGWMRRFEHLEDAFQMHLATNPAVCRFSPRTQLA